MVLVTAQRFPGKIDTEYSICHLFSDRAPGDEDEPDLQLYATLDVAALQDVRQVGATYVRSYEAVLHNTSSLHPGYLPEQDATHLLCGAIHMLELSCYLEERAAKLKRESLGRILVSLAGSPPNCHYAILDSFFGLKEGVCKELSQMVSHSEHSAGSPGQASGTPQSSSIPTHLLPSGPTKRTTPSLASDSDSRGKQSPEATGPLDFFRGRVLILGPILPSPRNISLKLIPGAWIITVHSLYATERGLLKKIQWQLTFAGII